jgi:hypothetical protein
LPLRPQDLTLTCQDRARPCGPLGASPQTPCENRRSVKRRPLPEPISATGATLGLLPSRALSFGPVRFQSIPSLKISLDSSGAIRIKHKEGLGDSHAGRWNGCRRATKVAVRQLTGVRGAGRRPTRLLRPTARVQGVTTHLVPFSRPKWCPFSPPPTLPVALCRMTATALSCSRPAAVLPRLTMTLRPMRAPDTLSKR